MTSPATNAEPVAARLQRMLNSVRVTRWKGSLRTVVAARRDKPANMNAGTIQNGIKKEFSTYTASRFEDEAADAAPHIAYNKPAARTLYSFLFLKGYASFLDLAARNEGPADYGHGCCSDNGKREDA